MAVGTYALTTRKKVTSYRLANGEPLKTSKATDAILDNLINNVTAAFESYCDRKFKTRTYTEYYDSEYGNDRIYLNQFPIEANGITSIHDDLDWSWGSPTLVASSNYRVSHNRYIVLKNSAASFNEGTQTLKVVYVAGYTTIPADLENACVVEVLRLYDAVDNKAIGLAGKSCIDTTRDYIITTFIPSTLTILKRYLNMVAF